MTDIPAPLMNRNDPFKAASATSSGSLSSMRARLQHLKWLVPLALLAVVAIYEAGPSQWLRHQLSANWNLLIDLVLYGTVGPALAFAILHFLERWIEERETSDLQARLLARTRRQAETTHQLTDDTLQALFAANTLLTSLEQAAPDLSPEAAKRLHEAQAALTLAAGKLRQHLLNAEKADHS